ncbi:AAA family ATPase [Glutamicibacter halophytocola]|uniref:AAA family ATPase n=1 Tax=Glutamicibacter halophytocola TaxID=1933880 RepID=UPI003219BA6C
MNAFFDSLPVRRIAEHPKAPMDRTDWAAQIPAVRQVLDEGLELGRLTVLVGENGAGKSTLVEGIAGAFGLNPEGGTRNSMHQTQMTESGLSSHLQLERGAGASKAGVFLRAETMHGLFAYLGSIGSRGKHNFQSHGESFIEFFTERSSVNGLWVFDEAESALSFNGCLMLLSHISDLLRKPDPKSSFPPIRLFLSRCRRQKSMKSASGGIRPASYDELEMVSNWRLFLDAPGRYLRHFDA